jgi:hypothetical protein
VGAAILAAHAYQHHGQASEVLVALLGGTAALGTHGLRTAGNLAASHLPVPFANLFVSGAASVAFLAGFALYLMNAVIALGAFAAVVTLSFWLVPRLGGRLWGWYRGGFAAFFSFKPPRVLAAPPSRDIGSARHTLPSAPAQDRQESYH